MNNTLANGPTQHTEVYTLMFDRRGLCNPNRPPAQDTQTKLGLLASWKQADSGAEATPAAAAANKKKQ